MGTHLITDKLHLDLPSSKAETPIEPLLDPPRLVVRLVPHESEAAFRDELGVGDGGARSEIGGSGEVGLEGVGGEGRGEVTKDESGPNVGAGVSGLVWGRREGDTDIMGGGSVRACLVWRIGMRNDGVVNADVGVELSTACR